MRKVMRHFIWVVALGVAGPLAAQNQPADNSDKPDKPPAQQDQPAPKPDKPQAPALEKPGTAAPEPAVAAKNLLSKAPTSRPWKKSSPALTTRSSPAPSSTKPASPRRMTPSKSARVSALPSS